MLRFFCCLLSGPRSSPWIPSQCPQPTQNFHTWHRECVCVMSASRSPFFSTPCTCRRSISRPTMVHSGKINARHASSNLQTTSASPAISTSTTQNTPIGPESSPTTVIRPMGRPEQTQGPWAAAAAAAGAVAAAAAAAAVAVAAAVAAAAVAPTVASAGGAA